MLLLHITLAITSLIWNAITWLTPSQRKLGAAYGLTTGTLATGTYLVISTHQAMLGACTAGLLYLGVSLAAILAARHKLATATTP